MFDLQIADEVVYAFVLLLNTSDIVSRYSELQLRKLGITDTQFRVLVTLRSCEEPPTLTELEQKLFRSKKGLTTVIDHMERDGLVKREKDSVDGRAIRVVTTEKGRALFESVRLPSRELVHRIMSCYEHEDIDRLSELLQKVRIHTLEALEVGNGQDAFTGKGDLDKDMPERNSDAMLLVPTA